MTYSESAKTRKEKEKKIKVCNLLCVNIKRAL